MNDKIILYVDNQMTDSERLQFERELRNSEKLRAELKNHRELLTNLKRIKEIPDDYGYFVNLLPRFRAKLDENKLFKYYPQFALVMSFIIVAFMMVLFSSLPVKEYKTHEIFSDTDNNEVSQLLDEYPVNNIRDLAEVAELGKPGILDETLLQTLDIKTESDVVSAAINHIDYDALLSSLNENEAESIYNELINKRIF